MKIFDILLLQHSLGPGARAQAAPLVPFILCTFLVPFKYPDILPRLSS